MKSEQIQSYLWSAFSRIRTEYVWPFSTWSNGSTWQPTVFSCTQKIRVNITSRLLCAILNRSLMFNAHLKKLTTSLQPVFISSEPQHTLSRAGAVPLALIHSKLDDAAPAWQLWLSATNLSCSDRLQNRSLSLITGQLLSKPLEALKLPYMQQPFNPEC